MKLKVKGICFRYGSRGVLRDVELEARAGEILAIIGPNGAGKSTLIRCINRILKPYLGTVFLDGKEFFHLKAQERAQIMGYVPQTSGEAFPCTVFETVLMGRKPHLSWGVGKGDLEVVGAVLQRLGLAGFAERYLAELSGGERQKVYLARALTQEPDVLLLDEPTSNLDVKHQLEVLELVRDVAKQQEKCVLMVMHDLNLAVRFSDQLLMLKDGLVFAAGNPQGVLTPENIRAVYEVEAMIVPTSLGPYVITARASNGAVNTGEEHRQVAASIGMR
ncbi:MAG: ABC transporter ATP-binding protein [Bacillota bacterium]|nr:ABC transporter ATP-binding protein [Bacillota bacterium]